MVLPSWSTIIWRVSMHQIIGCSGASESPIVKTLKRWAAAGMPHACEADGQMWIEGRQFAAWVRRSVAQRRRALAEHEGFCMKCRSVVAPEAWEPARHGKMSLRRGACPACGERVFHGRVGEGRGRG